jgi:hypothetical protein
MYPVAAADRDGRKVLGEAEGTGNHELAPAVDVACAAVLQDYEETARILLFVQPEIPALQVRTSRASAPWFRGACRMKSPPFSGNRAI